MTIHYFCPDLILQSAGIRILYRHVEVLVRNDRKAAVLHEHTGFTMPDVPAVPVAYLDDPGAVQPGDAVVVPEGFANIWASLVEVPLRRFVIALNWDYIYRPSQQVLDWRMHGVERVLTHSPFIADFVAWSMRLPVTVFKWGIKPSLYFPGRAKRAEIVFIARKEHRLDALQAALYNRDPRCLTQIAWTALHELSEADYASAIRRAFMFLSMSQAEGLPCSLLEAMACHTLVAGYNSVGGQRELIGSGPKQNAILAETLDYPTLALRIEPVLLGMLGGDVGGCLPILKNAHDTSAAYNQEAEEASILKMWQEIIENQ